MAKFEKFVSAFTVWAGGAILLLMMLQIMLDVFLRQLAGTSFPATAELVAKYYMIAVSFLPVAFTELKRRHVEATIFSDMLPAVIKPILLLLGFVLAFLLYCLLTYGTGREALRQTAQGAYVEAGAVDFLTWPSYWILPISFGLMAIVLLMRIVTVVNGSFHDHPHDPTEEIDSHAGEVAS